MSAGQPNSIEQTSCIEFRDIDEFLSNCDAFLHRTEDLHNPLIAMSYSIARSQGVFGPAYWFGRVADAEGNTVACGIHAMPDGLVVAGESACAIAAMIDAVSQSIGKPTRILGPRELTLPAFQILDKTDEGKSISSWGVYRLDTVPSGVAPMKGRLRLASNDDKALIDRWSNQYAQENESFLSVPQYILRRLAEGQLFLWDHDGPKTMVAVSGQTLHGTRISAVFTPTEFRGQKFASSAIVEISRTLLNKEGSFIVLHTREGTKADLLYQRLGFTKVGNMLSITTNQTS